MASPPLQCVFARYWRHAVRHWRLAEERYVPFKIVLREKFTVFLSVLPKFSDPEH